MSTVLVTLALLFLLLHLYRQYWTYRDLPRVQRASFEGELYRVGATCIARRPATSEPTKTIICFPGFLEDMRYFQALYADVGCELILVNNADYHCPFPTAHAQQLDWPHNPYPVGSIEHDGFCLAQTLSNLAQGAVVILHGHSRGGAVILEAGRQFPDLMKSEDRVVRAILEAPVLPQARTVGNGSEPMPHRLICYFMPIVLGLCRNSATKHILKQPMMKPNNELKTEVCASIYTNPRRYRTCIANVKSIRNWQAGSECDLYRNFERIDVVVGERDDVLDNPSMLASAEGGRELNPGVRIHATANSNHFPALELPDYMLQIAVSGDA